MGNLNTGNKKKMRGIYPLYLIDLLEIPIKAKKQ